jgi:hypothetical protein
MQVLALMLVFVVHVIGGALLVWALLDDDTRSGWRRRWRRGADEPPRLPLEPPATTAVRPPLPLPDATPSALRLREPYRAGAGFVWPGRRPAHAPGVLPDPVPGRPARRS